MNMKTRASLAILLCLLLATPSIARADDLADEADLQFNLAAERYKAGDFRGALEHFLASNRLVPNRNVVFNIARTYEQLKLYPDAFRYYTQALDGETDAKAQRLVEEGRARVAPFVAVLRVQSDPPGATIYIDRRDLGSRGNTPRTLGLPAGRYKVIAELAGYEAAESPPVDVRVGAETPVVLKLVPILGQVTVAATPTGATIRLDREDGAVLGSTPATVQLPPGRHVLFLSRDGFQTQEINVDVPIRGAVSVRPRMTPLTGSVVVNTDVRDALIEVDGEPKGFTPSVLSVPVGSHRVRISMSGFRSVEQDVTVKVNEQARVELALQQVEEVTAASRVTETVEDAPSSVTIISGQELRMMGYPTIAEALRGVRGLYISDNRNYAAVGVRGFGRLGDYGNRLLVLQDGMPLNDNYIWSSYVGFDGRTDLDDVERIEVVRGPGSVLYGTSAFSGVVNLVTRSRNAPSKAEAAVSAAQDAVGRMRVTGQYRFSPDAGVWTSFAGGKGYGRDFFFPEFQAEEPHRGQVRGSDGFESGTVNGRVWYKALTLQWLFHSRKKQLPGAPFESIVGDPRTRFTDTRGLLEARFEPKVSNELQLLSRGFGNLYEFVGVFAFPSGEGGAQRDNYTGHWAGLEQRAIWTPSDRVRITAGGEIQRHFKTRQIGVTETDVVIDRDDPFTTGAGYLTGDVTPVPWLKASAGARLDWYSTFGTSINPRLAFIVRPGDRTNVKLLGGKAFRAPSVYELYYTGANQLTPPPGSLRPEEIWSGEVEVTHRFSTTVTGTLAGFTNYVTDLIVLGGSATAADPNIYRNSPAPVVTVGGEAELRRDFRQGWMLAATYSLQSTRYVNNTLGLREVPNSPTHLASLKGAVPIIGKSLAAMTRLSLDGPRFDRFEQPGDPAQEKVDVNVVWDAVLSGEAEKIGVRYAVGVYNAMDTRYVMPLSGEFRQRTMQQSGRTVYLSASYTFF